MTPSQTLLRRADFAQQFWKFDRISTLNGKGPLCAAEQNLALLKEPSLVVHIPNPSFLCFHAGDGPRRGEGEIDKMTVSELGVTA